ncbi:PepSY domain-containing protein [Xylophilus sp. ASV27]|uniref:PepSY domain-containing protein n=1 Tax=Xylophilus sp. ASV27 TaxID=2795129 RepID=UPI0018EB0DDE|nr:PepSY domain-containing protein [Xylophilus sp. ASV27]
MHPFLRLLTVSAAALAAAGAHAHGDVRCDPESPKAEWRGQMELQRKLVAEGWKVRQVKTSNNCYEVYGFDEKGARVEVFFHPKTFEKVAEVKQPS